MNDELDNQIEADFQRDKKLITSSVTPKEIYKLAWLRGRTRGLDAGMQHTVIGEHVNESHLETVLEMQRLTT